MPKNKVSSEKKKQIVSQAGFFGATAGDKHVVEPSWTGPRAREATSEARLRHWMRGADTKCTMPNEVSFTENINWRIFRIIAEFVEGFELLSTLKNEVSMFGSARISSGSKYYQIAKELGALCGKHGFTVITGGGPGIMEAANQGAFEAGGESVGLDISLPKEQRRNPFVQKSMGFRYFFTRKVMLAASSQGYVFFPGGVGTLNELIEIVELIQTGKMSDQVPVILMGRTFWTPLLQWMKTSLLEEHRFIDREDLKIFQVVDSAKEAFEIIRRTHERTL